MPQTAKIFVSHSHEDNVWCRKFVEALRAKGANVWYDEEKVNAAQFTTQIEQELRSRPIFILVLSKAARQSRWVQREIDAAIWLHDRSAGDYLILQVTAEKCLPPLILVGHDNFCGEQKGEPGAPVTNTSSQEAAPLTSKEAADKVIKRLRLAPKKRPNRRYTKRKDAPVLVDTSPSAKESWERGIAHIFHGKHEEALQAFDNAIRLDPNQEQYWLDKGHVLLRLGRPELAASAFDEATRLFDLRSHT